MSRRAETVAAIPVVGLRPGRSFFERTWKEPKDLSLRSSPETITSKISASTASTMPAEFYARKADTPKHGVGEIGARHAARIPAGRIRRRQHQILHSAMVFVWSIAGPADRVTLS